MKIIGFGHRKRVGKDTAAKFLQTHLRIGMRKVSIAKGNLAYPLKQQCHYLYSWAGVREPEFYDTEEGSPLREIVLPDLGMTPRELWIKYGNKTREIYPDTWIRWQVNHAETVLKVDLLILADIRYFNEVDIVIQNGGKVYKIDREDAPISHDVADDALALYEGWGGILINNGSLNDFDRQVKAMVADPLIEEWNGKKPA